MKKYKVIFADLDDTLIHPIMGETFPKGIWDMLFRFDVLDAIKELKPLCVFIVSNQGGIEKGFVKRADFEAKVDYISRSVSEYVGCYVESLYCDSNDKGNYFRKPNAGMLASLFRKCQLSLFRPENVTKEDCLMIGDASGKDGQFSDSDKKTAENFGIDYLDVEDFLLEMSEHVD